mmetsp:Transcript_34347/g.57668  ORF Transcript_34347/g.57668 Transcript_34347/m.57668 type:complete len:257 (+) Transcript_34347:971-1741(+)
MLQLAAAPLQQPLRQELLLVVLVEHHLHLHPKAFLPLEDRLLGDHVRGAVVLVAALVEDVREVRHVVKGIAVGDDGGLGVFDIALVDHLDTALLWEKEGGRAALADHLISCTVLPPNRLPLEKHGPLEAELHALDVDRIAADGDPVPAPAHRAVGRSPRLLQPKLLLLHGARRDRRLLEDGAYPGPRLHGRVQHLILSVITRLAGQIVVLPLGRVNIRSDPLLHYQFHAVMRHLLPGDVHHGGCLQLVGCRRRGIS